MIIFLLTLITTCLVLLVIGFALVWKKIDVYLTWNTRYDSQAYEQAITTPKVKQAFMPAHKTTRKGRNIKDVDDLVDLADMDFETVARAIETAGEDGS